MQSASALLAQRVDENTVTERRKNEGVFVEIGQELQSVFG